MTCMAGFGVRLANPTNPRLREQAFLTKVIRGKSIRYRTNGLVRTLLESRRKPSWTSSVLRYPNVAALRSAKGVVKKDVASKTSMIREALFHASPGHP